MADIPQSPTDQLAEETKETAPGTGVSQNETEAGGANDAEDESDDDSILSEVDEAQFKDFDASNIALDDRPAIAVDESNVGQLGIHKRKQTDDGSGEGRKKRKKRDKLRRKRRRDDVADDFVGGEEMDGKRIRKRAEGGNRRERDRPSRATPEEETNLTPEESG